ncbi:penicillin-binding protein 1A [Desulforhopalus singaporensis]|uniref:Penicillin-binding protein 1A n=1 Tax=Desulforhopalus singaporensis TaxID=91360 RepID=A0A1H0J7S5_9BACT|nr:PBP1A family penicillin-binding protein [Desulforhopalus singaporensis]SDO39785.1 penicillin-binding protein 1A [Desulforhopalus singaporensis]
MSPTKRKSNPVKGKTKPAARRKIYTEKHVYLFLLITCLVQTGFLFTLLLVQMSLQIPDIGTVAKYQPAQATLIYDRRGDLVDRVFVENRTVVPLTKMSPYLAKAFVAAEDGRFFEHPGLDFFSVLRAAIINVKNGEKSQGGSTITQQVAKSLLLSPEKTYVRKFKEAILAWRIDKVLTKDEILFIYLNQIYLGEGTHGVEAAAQLYFGKSAAALSLGECALLAGLPQAPSRYSLFDHLDRAVERQKYVLNRMAADGYVSGGEARRAFDKKIELKNEGTTRSDDNGYYLQIVKKRARELLHVPLQTAGLKIYTCLDSRMQKSGAKAVRTGVVASKIRQERSGNKVGEELQGALVCVETATGKVRAVVGGTSFRQTPFDRATLARRPVGSTFKPFVYAAALTSGWSPQSIIEDSPVSITGSDGRRWQPKNYSGKYHGKTTLENALVHSLNAASVRLMQATGFKTVHRIAAGAGITAKLPPDLSLALGSADVSLLEMTSAYTAFAGNGTVSAPDFIEKIVFPDGSVRVIADSNKKNRVLTEEVNARMREMLRGVVTRGTGKKVRDVTGVSGGKTGTSNDNRDAWFIGYDNRYTTGVWVGFDHNHSMGAGESGGATAAPIWRDFMLHGGVN